MTSSSVDPLDRYFKVNLGEKQAHFRKIRKIPVDIDLSSDESVLWQEHDKLVLTKPKSDEKPKVSLLDLKIELAERIIESCSFCERKCEVNRKEGKLGTCNCPYESKVASDFIHVGEEAEVIPSYTIFFAGCTFKCVFCQNFDISQNAQTGRVIEPKKIAEMIDSRRKNGARNVNFVGGDPTPHIHTILRTLKEVTENISVIFNSNMYLSEKSMKLLDGVVDLYLTDFKYYDNNHAKKYSKIDNFFEVVSRNHLSAKKHAELLIRHLVMPTHIECCTKNILQWICDNLGENTRVNCMFQFRPEYHAYQFGEISRRLTLDEKKRVFDLVKEIGLKHASH